MSKPTNTRGAEGGGPRASAGFQSPAAVPGVEIDWDSFKRDYPTYKTSVDVYTVFQNPNAALKYSTEPTANAWKLYREDNPNTWLSDFQAKLQDQVSQWLLVKDVKFSFLVQNPQYGLSSTEPEGIDDVFSGGQILNYDGLITFWDRLCSAPSAERMLNSMMHDFLLRGRQTRLNNTKKQIGYRFNLTPEDAKKVWEGIDPEAPTMFPIWILMSDGFLNVESMDLNMDRAKCLARSYVIRKGKESRGVALPLAEYRLAATSETCGYARYIRFLFMEAGADVKATGLPTNIVDDRNLATAAKTAIELYKTGAFNIDAALGGGATSKELYLPELTRWTGIELWMGCALIMTDVANRFIAPSRPESERARFNNSNFFGSWKVRAAARGIILTEAFSKTLQVLGPAMVRCIRMGAGMNAIEADTIDSMLSALKARHA